jgi:hypothetical protein
MWISTLQKFKDVCVNPITLKFLVRENGEGVRGER